MDELTFIQSISVMRKDISAAIKSCTEALYSQFNPSSQENERTEQEYNMHKAMIDYKVFTELASTYKKGADQAKKSMDVAAEALGMRTDTDPNMTTIVYSGELIFTKRQNKDSTSTAVNDVVTELAKMGVDPALVKKAVANAAKTKRGAVYYDVELSG
jgi:hypothetical protein